MTYIPTNVPKMVAITIRRNLTARHGVMTTGMIMGAILSAAATRPAAPPRPSQPAALVRHAALLLLRPGVPHAKDSFPLTKTSCDVGLFTTMHRELQLLASLTASQGVRDVPTIRSGRPQPRSLRRPPHGRASAFWGR